jgi:hypothetical protein
MVISLAVGVLVAGLVLASVAFGLQGVEVMSWVAGSASLVVTVVTLIVGWPAARRDGEGAPGTSGKGGEMATDDIDQNNSGGTNVANTGHISSVRIGGPAPESTGGAEPADGAVPDGEVSDAPRPAPGTIRQRNTGGSNVASSGTIGSIDLSQ